MRGVLGGTPALNWLSSGLGSDGAAHTMIAKASISGHTICNGWSFRTQAGLPEFRQKNRNNKLVPLRGQTQRFHRRSCQTGISQGLPSREDIMSENHRWASVKPPAIDIPGAPSLGLQGTEQGERCTDGTLAMSVIWHPAWEEQEVWGKQEGTVSQPSGLHLRMQVPLPGP